MLLTTFLCVAGCGQSRTASVAVQDRTSTPSEIIQGDTAPPIIPRTTPPQTGTQAKDFAPQAQSFEKGSLEVEIQRAFDWVLGQLRPVHVYAPTALPDGARLAERWYPLIPTDGDSGAPQSLGESDGGAQSSGSEATDVTAVPNPRLSGGGGEPQADIVIDIPGGTLLFVENFRGDLGDASGERVGSVDGHAATAYDLQKGWLVQWSDSGRWYGVYGVGITLEEIYTVVLGTHLVPAE